MGWGGMGWMDGWMELVMVWAELRILIEYLLLLRFGNCEFACAVMK